MVFDYLPMLHHVFYVPALVAGLALLGTAFAGRRTSLWFLYAWIVGVVTPHLLAATKTPSATLIALPASFLLVGRLASEALERGGWPLRAWAGVTVVSLVHPVDVRTWGRGYPSPPVFGGVMWQSTWIIGHLVAALGLALALGALDRTTRWRGPVGLRVRALGSPRTLRVVASAGLVVLLMQGVHASWGVTRKNWPCRVAGLASFARRHLPDRAVLLFAIEDRGEHQEAMFLSGRTSYQLRGRPIDDTARQASPRGRDSVHHQRRADTRAGDLPGRPRGPNDLRVAGPLVSPRIEGAASSPQDPEVIRNRLDRLLLVGWVALR